MDIQRTLTDQSDHLNEPPGRRISLLFVCSRNQWRSPTAERVYRNDERVNSRSRGTSTSAAKPISSTDLHWADLVLVMETKHRKSILTKFRDLPQVPPIEVLDIPDIYRFMDEELIECIRGATDPMLDAHFSPDR